MWGREITGCFSKRIRECKEKLKRLRSRQDADSISKYEEVRQQLYLILDQKEIFWRQRSKQLWLESGDKNTKYFHASSSTRRRRNQIHKLKTVDGDWRTWQDGLPNLIEDFFQKLFTSNQMQGGQVIDCVSTTISADQNRELIRGVTEEEVKRAIFQMHPDKAPGPDGMTPAFFQKHWSVVGKEVVNMVRDFFLTGELIDGINETNIVLIPKKNNPVVVGDLRPISLCNVLMKVITKVIANRLKELLGRVVSDTQSAFVPGRLISDNIMISYEVMHYLKRKTRGKEGYMAIKLDMSKAYDRIEWDFLKNILLNMGFDDWWVQLVLRCVTTVSYNVVHGEYEMGPIQPSRGIRQGDPLSPYLFIMCAEGLSSLIRKYENRGWIHGIKVCRKAPIVSHMLFADDSYIYCKADVGEANKIRELLQEYEQASGQKVNIDKSSVFFSSNVISYNKVLVCQALQMLEADNRSKYLGLPNTMGRNKSVILGFLKDKVHARIKTWDGKYISRAGKEILIKSVAQALPSYAMSVFLLPFEITREIEKCLSKFWWHSRQSTGKGLNWMSWERMTKHKVAGGLGFRNFRDYNLAMLGKQGWRFLTNPESLVSKSYKARYFADKDFLNASLGYSPSFIWRSIFEAKSIVAAGARWRIGPGTQVNITGQPWLADGNDPFITTVSHSVDNRCVASLFCMDRKEWDVEVVRDVFNMRDQECIFDMIIEEDLEEDVLYWKMEQSGVYSVKSAYKYLQVQKGAWRVDENDDIWKKLWSIKAPPKALNLVWRALSNILPTLTQLQQKHVDVQNQCPFCKNDYETIFHVLIACPFSVQCWQVLDPRFSSIMTVDFAEWLKNAFGMSNKKQKALIITLFWILWRARNDLIWNRKYPKMLKVVADAKKYLAQWTAAQGRSTSALITPEYTGDGAQSWVKPQPNTIKVSVDAAIFAEREEYGFGLIARDSEGELRQAETKIFKGIVSSVVAEAMAIKEALSWIDRMRWSKVSLESDCLVVIQAIRSKVKMRSCLGGIIEECRWYLKSLNKVSLYFVKRSANTVAHTLARASYRYPDRSFDRWSVPIEVMHCIVADLYG